MEKFFVSAQRENSREEKASEFIVDVEEIFEEGLNLSSQEMQNANVVHNILFDHIKFFTYMTFSLLALVGFIINGGKVTPKASLQMIAAAFLLAGIILLFLLIPLIKLYIENLPKLFSFSLIRLRLILCGLIVLFLLLGFIFWGISG